MALAPIPAPVQKRLQEFATYYGIPAKELAWIPQEVYLSLSFLERKQFQWLNQVKEKEAVYYLVRPSETFFQKIFFQSAGESAEPPAPATAPIAAGESTALPTPAAAPIAAGESTALPTPAGSWKWVKPEVSEALGESGDGDVAYTKPADETEYSDEDSDAYFNESGDEADSETDEI